MAQRNRRRGRGGGSNRNGDASSNQPVNGGFPELQSGEEQLTEAQMALGRPDLADTPSEAELTAFEEQDAGRGEAEAGLAPGTGAETPDAAGLAPAPGVTPSAGALSTRRSERQRSSSESEVARAHKPGLGGQLTGFLQGSWRELQRVQWPDRRQVFQATGVVLGFVIVAGAFLGVSSWAAQKIVNLILYGHG